MEASLKSCTMARDFWKSQLVCTTQEWIVFLVFIGDEDSKNSLSLNLDSSLKLRECCHSSLLYCCDLQLVLLLFYILKKSKAQRHDTDTSLEGWESNTRATVISTVPHIFITDSKKSLYISVRYIIVSCQLQGSVRQWEEFQTT